MATNGNIPTQYNGERQYLNPVMTVAAATAGAQFVNQAANKIHRDRTEGPLTYRAMAFIGGLGLIATNVINGPSRFFSFHFAGAMISFYNFLFGWVIVFLEGPGCGRCGGGRVRYFAKFLEFTAGRGIFYFFCGSLQVANVNMLDWAVGGWMVVTGVIAIGVGVTASRQLNLLRFSVKTEEELKEKWLQFDTNHDGYFDIKELSKFAEASGLRMTRNEVAASFLALDRNFDDRISYEEFYAWWSSDGGYGHQRSLVV